MKTCSAFINYERTGTGRVLDVAIKVKTLIDKDPNLGVLFFDDVTGAEFDLDLRGNTSEIASRLLMQFPVEPASSDSENDVNQDEQILASAEGEAKPEAKPLAKRVGRPKLNVVAKEVTLQPRHWQWLKNQQGSASSVLRRLVDEARRANEQKDKHSDAQKAAYTFISAIVGDHNGYEDAIRALFKGDYAGFEEVSRQWPEDVYLYAQSFYADLGLME